MCKIKDLEPGKTRKIDAALLKNITEKSTKRGKPYVTLTLYDGETEINVNFWDHTAEDIRVAKGSVIAAQIECGEYEGEKTYVLKKYGPAPNASPEEFIKHSPGRPEKMFAYCIKQAETLPDDLKTVTIELLLRNKQQLLYWQGAMKVHHAYQGGLLYHISRMLYMAGPAAKVYHLNEDLLKAGIILHDIGKLRELTEKETGVVEYSVDGNLFGHALLGVKMVDEVISDKNIEMTENLRLLENIIASHHILPEHGAAAKPASREAYAIGLIDNMDAKIDLMDEVLKDTGEGECTDRIRYADNLILYKPFTEAQ